jgi:site-specific recombinase XerD
MLISSDQAPALKVLKLKEEQRVLPTFSTVDVSAFVKWKPSTTCERRLKLLILMLTDMGCRISEALDLSWDNVDYSQD